MLTRADILVAIAAVEEEVRRWEASRDEALIVGYNGRPTKALNADIERAAVTLFELCERTDVEEDARPLIQAVDKFDDEFAKFGELAKDLTSRVHPGGTREMWGSYAEMLRARVPMKWDRPEPLRQLIAQRVGMEQIAKIYHWLKPYGISRACEMIQEELDAPGTHYNADTWVHPKEVAYRAEINTWWEKRCETLRNAQVKRQRAAEPKARTEARETLDELILNGVNATQICKMKPGLTEDDVQARAAELGYALDTRTVAYASFRQAQLAREATESRSAHAALEEAAKVDLNARPAGTLNTYPEFGDDIEGRVVRMAEDGLRPGKIADALRHLPGAPNAGQVGKILKSFEVSSEPQ